MGRKRRPDEEEETFVRGGGTGLTPAVERKLKEEAYAEAEADVAAGAKGGKRRKSGAGGGAAEREGGDAEDAFFSSLALQDRLPKYVELLKFKGLSVGCKLWGAVIEVSPRELVVSLPHGLRGHVAYAHASDWLAEQSKKAAAAAAGGEAGGEGGGGSKKRKAAAGGAGAAALPPLASLFAIGQLVRGTVVGLQPGGGALEGKGGSKRKRVDLSLHVSKMNAGLGAESLREGLALPACVRSEEDHGFTLALGIKGVTGFLPKAAAAAAGRPLAPGMLLDVVVPPGGAPKPAGGGAAVVALACAPDAVAGAVAREWEGLNIGSLLPGALVTARVRHVLSDGLLCSFLTYFSGTVDPFHLGTELGVPWRQQFSPSQRLRARILFVDPAQKRVGLTLHRHLLAAALPPNFPALGQAFEGATVRRVDPGLGLLLELPSEGLAAPLAPGYAHVSAVAEGRVDDLAARFRTGQRVRARVVGFRPMDGLAVLSLKPSVVESSILSLADVRPGMAVGVTVNRVEEWGLLVALSSSIRALVPTLHASDLGSAKALRKFKVGQRRVAGRVLAVDPATKKVTVTLKPSVVGSKLPPIARLEDAAPGARSHGVVTGARDFGVFVSFFGGVAGLAHASECGLAEGQKPGDCFKPGQVVKCRVLGADSAGKGLRLSLVTKPSKGAAEAAAPGASPPAKAGEAAGEAAAAAALAAYAPGDVVRGTVTAVHAREGEGEEGPAWFELSVAPEAGGRPAVAARLEAAHLADHPAAAAALAASLAAGADPGPLLVLQRLEGARQLRVTRKASLLAAAAAGRLPGALADVAEGALLPGYVASVTGDAVFVRFLDGLTGRAGLAQLADTFVADPHLHYRPGQSVRASVAQVDAGRQRFSLSLKQSLCASADASYLRGLLSDLAVAQRLGGEADATDWAALAIGAVVPAEVHEAAAYGLVCDLAGAPDALGLAASHQAAAAGSAEPGTAVQALILDVNQRDGIVDLSLQPRLVHAAQKAAAEQQQQQPKKKQRRQARSEAAAQPPALALGQQLEATVELVKEREGYCVVSLPPGGGGPLLGCLAAADYNAPDGARAYAPGDSVAARVAALPSADTGGRLLLAAAQPAARAASRAGKAAAHGASRQQGSSAAAPPPAPPVGSCVEATVGAVHALHADLQLPGGHHGRLHITQAAPAAGAGAGASPLAALAPGATLPVAVLGRVRSSEGRRHGLLECSAAPEAVAAAKVGQPLPKGGCPGWPALRPGQQLHGFVQEVERGYVWCCFSPAVRGRAFAAQASSSVDECERLGKRFRPGQPVASTVAHVDAKRKALDLSLAPAGAGADAAPAPGAAVLARVSAVGGAGVRLQLSARLGGRVALTDVHDGAVQQATAGLEAGQYCRAVVLGPDPAAGGKKGGAGKAAGEQLLLTLRPSAGGQCAAHGAAQARAGDGPPVADAPLDAGQLKPGQRVAGYVKSAGPAGVFVCLARNLDARIRLSQLSDGFVEAPAEAFPEGRLVEAQVLKVDGGKVELSLRSRKPPPSLEALAEGQVVRGRVTRVAAFGVFVELDGQPGGVTGLAHVSEVADDFVKELGALFTPGQRVVARVLKVDREGRRLSLGLKPSYFEDMSDLEGSEGGEGGQPDFDAQLAAAADSSDDEAEAVLRGARLGGAGSGSEEEEESDEDEGSSGSGSGSGSGSDEEGGEAGGAASGSGSEGGSGEQGFDLDEELVGAGGGSSSESDD